MSNKITAEGLYSVKVINISREQRDGAFITEPSLSSREQSLVKESKGKLSKAGRNKLSKRGRGALVREQSGWEERKVEHNRAG